MICPICKNEIKEDSKFCTKCGKKIPRCPTCNKVLTKKMQFCTNDGTPLPEEIFAAFSDMQKVSENGPEQPVQNPAPMQNTVSVQNPAPVQNPISGTMEKTVPQQPAVTISAENRAPKKKKSFLPLLCILLFIIIAVLLGYIVLKDSDALEMFSQNNTENTGSGEDDGKGTVIDRSGTDEEETIEETGEDASGEETDEATLPEDGGEESGGAAERPTEEMESSTAVEVAEPALEVEEIDPIEYFILNCDKEYFTKEDLSVFDADMCRIARNGIYARLGRKFQDEALTEYFMQFDWYNPTIDPEDFSDDLLNEYQIANRDLIVEYEEEQGYR